MSGRAKFREMLSQRVVPPGITPVLGDGAFGIPNRPLAFGAMDLIPKKWALNTNSVQHIPKKQQLMGLVLLT